MIRIWELELKQQPKTRKEKKGNKKKGKKEKEEGKEQWVQAKLEFGEEDVQEQPDPSEEEEESQEQKKLALTPILPIVFYHGTQEWQVPLNFQDHGHACPPYFFRSSRLACPLCAQFSVLLV